MNYWLMKTEPSVFGIDDLIKKKQETDCWEGIRNYQVRNMIRDQMRVGDLAFLYHSNCNPPGIAGIIKIVSEAYPDPYAFDPESRYYDPKSSTDKPRWYTVDVKFVKKFKQLLTLPEIRQIPSLHDMRILRKGNRLSITSVAEVHWNFVLELINKQEENKG